VLTPMLRQARRDPVDPAGLADHAAARFEVAVERRRVEHPQIGERTLTIGFTGGDRSQQGQTSQEAEGAAATARGRGG
jgi:hypothetical protein